MVYLLDIKNPYFKQRSRFFAIHLSFHNAFRLLAVIGQRQKMNALAKTRGSRGFLIFWRIDQAAFVLGLKRFRHRFNTSTMRLSRRRCSRFWIQAVWRSASCCICSNCQCFRERTMSHLSESVISGILPLPCSPKGS